MKDHDSNSTVSRRQGPGPSLLPATGLAIGLALAFACGPDATEKDPEYQKRIDAHCRHHCDKESECTPRAESPFSSTSACFEEGSQGDYWWKGGAECKEARWAFDDCLDTIVACEVWSIPATAPSPCEDLWPKYVEACADVAAD
jgi:hypothetical protein